MGSRPWIAAFQHRLLGSAQYRSGQPFTVRRRSICATGPVETGTANGAPVIFVADEAEIRIDRETLVDGIPAFDWRADQEERER